MDMIVFGFVMLCLCYFPNLALSVFESNNGWSCTVPFRIRDNLWFAAFKHSDA
jgi:hypothetical protein